MSGVEDLYETLGIDVGNIGYSSQQNGSMVGFVNVVVIG